MLVKEAVLKGRELLSRQDQISQDKRDVSSVEEDRGDGHGIEPSQHMPETKCTTPSPHLALYMGILRSGLSAQFCMV